MAQSLARHSDINLTMNVYTDVVLEDQAIAVELLPSLPSLATFLPAPVPTKVPGIHKHIAKLRETGNAEGYEVKRVGLVASARACLSGMS